MANGIYQKNSEAVSLVVFYNLNNIKNLEKETILGNYLFCFLFLSALLRILTKKFFLEIRVCYFYINF